MQHGAPTEWKREKSEAYKTKLGLIMIGIYTALYLIFMFLSVLNPRLMAIDIGSLNLAIAYGFALIIIAIVQAVIYNYLCSRKEKLDDISHDDKGEVAK
jgi:uncharacterized membrane protein (DUF485 family)